MWPEQSVISRRMLLLILQIGTCLQVVCAPQGDSLPRCCQEVGAIGLHLDGGDRLLRVQVLHALAGCQIPHTAWQAHTLKTLL